MGLLALIKLLTPIKLKHFILNKIHSFGSFIDLLSLPHDKSIVLFKNNYHVFYGYYDTNPFSNNDDLVLASCVRHDLKTPQKNSLMYVGYFNIKKNNPTFIHVGDTETWSWQQGCRLRWYSSKSNNLIIYNKIVNGRYGSIIQNILNKRVHRTISYPLYDICKAGVWGLSLNFSRLQRLRPGYGYTIIDDISQHSNCPENDGVWLVNIKEDKASLVVSTKMLASYLPHESMNEATHYINHLQFNPGGSHFLLIHLWVDQTNKRYSRLFCVNRSTGDFVLLNNSGHVSHFNWINNDYFVLVAKIAENTVRYLKYHRTAGFSEIVGFEHLHKDGHPSYFSDGKTFITDTYPNLFGVQRLLLYQKSKKPIVLDRHFSPTSFRGEVRCDLHPRLSTSEKYICFDIVFNNYRAIKILHI